MFSFYVPFPLYGMHSSLLTSAVATMWEQILIPFHIGQDLSHIYSQIFSTKSSSDMNKIQKPLENNILGIDVREWRQCVVFSWRYENIGFQNLVVTYWPSSWLRPFSLCGAVTWSWISNASRTFRSNLRPSTFNVFTFSQSNPALHIWEWFCFVLLWLNG